MTPADGLAAHPEAALVLLAAAVWWLIGRLPWIASGIQAPVVPETAVVVSALRARRTTAAVGAGSAS